MKRIYKTVSTTEQGAGHVVQLDGRELKSPAKAPLVLPTKALAEAVAGEWDAQGEEIAPDSMPNMQLAATATDRITTQRDAVIDEIAGFGGSDLLCYRAEEPRELIDAQQQRWQPLLDWCRAEFGAELQVTSGIMPLRQDARALETLKAEVAKHSDMELSALHVLTSGSGSLVIALAVSHGKTSAEEAFEISQIDEQYQIDKWGKDEEAEIRRANLHRDIMTAGNFFNLCREK